MTYRTAMRLSDIVKNLEKERNEKYPELFVEEVVEHCERKLKLTGKDEDYLPLLFMCELPMQWQIKTLTDKCLTRMGREREQCVWNADSARVRQDVQTQKDQKCTVTVSIAVKI